MYIYRTSLNHRTLSFEPYLIIRLLSGGVLGYILARLAFRKEQAQGFVLTNTYNLIKDQLTRAEKELAAQTQEIIGLTNELTALEQNEKHLTEKITGFKEELQRMHTLSHEQFKAMASAIMEDRSFAFVQTNKKELNEILSSINEGLVEFRQKVEAIRKEDVADLISLKKEIESLEKLNAARVKTPKTWPWPLSRRSRYGATGAKTG